MSKLVAWIDSIDPRKVAMAFSAITVVAGLIAGGQISLTNMVPATWIPYVIAWSKAIAIIAPALIGGHSALDLFGKNPMVAPAAKAALALFAVLLASLLMTAPASAQQQQRKPLSLVHVAAAQKAKPAPPVAAQAQAPAPPAAAAKGKQLTVAQAQQNLIAVIQQFALGDLQNALADATANNDTQGAACWTAMIALVQSPAINLLPNAPGGFLLFQKARDLKSMLANLQSPTGPLAPVTTACAPLIISAENTLIQLGVIGGGVTAVVASGGTAAPLLQGLLALLPIK